MTNPLVRAADIAELAGVSRAAVTQWRKRHDDFPSPIKDSSTRSPLFNRTDVTGWLTAHGKLEGNSSPVKSKQDIADGIEALLRGRDSNWALEFAGATLVAEYLLRAPAEATPVNAVPGNALGRPASTLQGMSANEARETISALAEDSRYDDAFRLFTTVPDPHGFCEIAVAIANLTADVAADELRDVYDLILTADRRHLPSDPEPVADLINGLVDVVPPTRGAAVIDPAVGIGKTLLEVGQRHPEVNLIGIDANPGALSILRTRSILAQRSVDTRVGNSLGANPVDDVLAATVVLTPPWGLRDLGEDFDPNDPRWTFGRPVPRSDGVWLQQAIAHLDDDGRAFVVTPSNELFRGGPTEALRHELVRQGALEAIVALPSGAFAPYTAIDTALWVLARPGKTVDPDRVLLARASQDPMRLNDTVHSFGDVVETYRQWRTTGSIPDDPHSVVVSARELLDPQSTLMPTTWIERRDAASPYELITEITELSRQVLSDTDVDNYHLSTVRARRQRITDFPGVTVHRGRPSRGDADDVGYPTDIPTLTPRAVVGLLETGKLVPEKFVPRADATFLTKSDDIVVMTHVTKGQPAAIRIDVEGWAVPQSCFVVRVDQSVPGAPNPAYLTACINAAASQQPSSRGLVRVVPARLDAPVMPRGDQDAIVRSLRDAEEARRDAAKRFAELTRLTTLIETAIGTGGITVDH
ncbi:N-6 DNA methylase [Gordonia shandongensis]|uniref:N-6 DNA methylase n=1 Tax=Gordonia shandongensis TaxID=376351 RepID=UPI000403C208|nr:N-6 DNA methylase [Gordonia shandongensis]